MLGRAIHADRKQRRVHRFGHEVESARAHRSDGILEATHTGDDDHRNIGAHAGDTLAQLDPAELRHVEISQDGSEVLVRDTIQRSARRSFGHCLVVLPLQHHLKQVTGGLIIVYD